MNNTFICTVCHNEYKKAWSDEEAMEELKDNFGDYDKDECDVVCDDCYEKMREDYPFSNFVESQDKLQSYRDEINQMFKDKKLKRCNVNGIIIEDFDSFNECIKKLIKSQMETYLLEGIDAMVDIRDIPFEFMK